MTTEVKAYPQFGGGEPKFMIHDDEIPNFEGRLALKLVEHFGIVAAQDDGEDSSGRRQLKLMEPNEVVARSCEIAGIMASALRERGWIVRAPSIKDAEDAVRAALANREAAKAR